jgi:hypothetical protein
MNYSLDDVDLAIEGLRSKLGVGKNQALQEEFAAGLHPHLLSYDKLSSSKCSLSVIEKYLVGAKSYLQQPSNFYDIFPACRAVNIVLFLNRALDALLRKKVTNLSQRLDRLTKESGHDPFDAVAFELITAARYLEHPSVTHVSFVEESPPKKTPDIILECLGIETSVECKKLDRSQNYTIAIRNAVRDSLNVIISSFRANDISALIDVTFHCDPKEVSTSQIVDASVAAFKHQSVIVEPEFTVKAARLPRYTNDNYMLYPSPDFFWKRYGFRIRSDWFGIVSQNICSRGRVKVPARLQGRLSGGESSWLDKLSWDTAVKWKISSEEVVAKYRRFAFDGLFKGIQQIKDSGLNSVVHLWLESEYYIGGRQSSLRDLLQRLSNNPSNDFGWVLINETLLDVSPKGCFDFIEHGHFIGGPGALTRKPIIVGIFLPDSSYSDTGEFGVGTELPDIDS